MNITQYEKKGYILMRSGVIFTYAEDRLMQIVEGMQKNPNAKTFLDPKGKPQFLSEIKQFLDEEEMKEYENRQSGKYRCDFGNWHTRNQICQCDQVYRSGKIFTSQHVVINTTRNSARYLTKEEALNYKLKEDEYWYEQEPQSKIKDFNFSDWRKEMAERFGFKLPQIKTFK
jgi:hypothetical protein